MRKKMARKLIVSLIRVYQKFISPLKGRATCKYYPTCSQYAIEAVEKNGILLGMLLAIWRILRCNPFSQGGYDPVPEIRRKKKSD